MQIMGRGKIENFANVIYGRSLTAYFDEGTPLYRGKYFRIDGDRLFTCGLWFLLRLAGIFAELRSVNCFWKTAERAVGRGRNPSSLVNANLYSTFSLLREVLLTSEHRVWRVQLPAEMFHPWPSFEGTSSMSTRAS